MLGKNHLPVGQGKYLKKKNQNLLGPPWPAAEELPILLLNFFTAADRVILFFTCLENPEEPSDCLWSSGIKLNELVIDNEILPAPLSPPGG